MTDLTTLVLQLFYAVGVLGIAIVVAFAALGLIGIVRWMQDRRQRRTIGRRMRWQAAR